MTPLPLSRFRKSDRLLSSRDFKRVFDQAPFRASNDQVLILARAASDDNSRLGIVAAKKHIRFAVGRNRFKRIVRESFRQRQFPAPIDGIVLARKNADNLSNRQLFSVLDDLWTRVAKKAQKSAVTDS